MSDVGFIPTTRQVREAYEVAHEEVGVPCDITGFDRWLNDIIRQAKAEALARLGRAAYAVDSTQTAAADAITDEMVERGAAEARAWGVKSSHGGWSDEETQRNCARDILEAAARPETTTHETRNHD